MRPMVLVGLAALLLIATACDPTSVQTAQSVPTSSVSNVNDVTTTVSPADRLAFACQEGNPVACDDLWEIAEPGSSGENLALTCGGQFDSPESGGFPDCAGRAVMVSTTMGTSTTSGTSVTASTVVVTTTRLVSVDEIMRLPEDGTWNAILSSVAVDSGPETTLISAQQVAAAGLPAGVFRSDDIPSMSPGFWVAYSGPFGTEREAVAACDRLRTVSGDCYARRFLTKAGFEVGTPSLNPPEPLPGSGGARGSGCVAASAEQLGDGIWFGYLVEWLDDSIGFDLVCWFTGAAADDAAASSGAELLENGDYISNQNALVRVVPISTDTPMSVVVQSGSGFAFVTTDILRVSGLPNTYTAGFNCPGPSCGVWLYVNGGAVTEVVEQYFP